MNRSTQDHKAHIQTRGALWASIVFYVLIAFEFFYMASPFTAYLYAVYGPGRDWLQASPWTSWTIQFFLPHVVAESRTKPSASSCSVGASPGSRSACSRSTAPSCADPTR